MNGSEVPSITSVSSTPKRGIINPTRLLMYGITFVLFGWVIFRSLS